MVMPGNALRLCRLRVANDSNPSLTTSVSKIISSTSSFVSFFLRVQHLLSPTRTHSDEHLQSVLQPPLALPLVCACSAHFRLHLLGPLLSAILRSFALQPPDRLLRDLLVSPQHALPRAAGGLLVLQRRSHPLRTLRMEGVRRALILELGCSGHRLTKRLHITLFP